MAKEKQPVNDQRTEIEKNDYSHLMLTGANYPEKDIPIRDGKHDVLFWDNHPDYSGSSINSFNASTSVVTGPVASFMQQFPSDRAWLNAGGMSIDGLFVPYATNFAVVSTGGERKNLNKAPDNSAMPTFERPYSVEKGGKPSDQVDFVNYNTKLGYSAPSPPTIDSSSLNPFASGHYIQMVNKNTKQVNPNTDVTGYSKHSSRLGKPNTESTETERPMGLRGPIVVAGWGYDSITSQPVPNLRFDSDYRHNEPKSANYGRQRYAPQTMKARTASGMQQDHKHFTPVHMRRPDKWKAGPVDLRWDHNRKVWVGGKHNGIFLSKATKCILPKSGIDGNNSFNFGVGGNINAPGRLYRNPCPTHNCNYHSYFPTSIYYPDIEIYDPEDHNWCGRCRTLGTQTVCGDFKDGCSPFYDAIILRAVDEQVGKNNELTECTDKFRKVQGGTPQARRAGNPCHGWGSSNYGISEFVNEKIGDDEVWTEHAKALLYQKIFIDNPLGQGLMVGDAFFSYDTGRRIVYEYERTDTAACGKGLGTKVKVKESIPVHVVLQGEFYGMEVISHAGCDRGEMGSCSRKFFAQGFATGEDCGPDDDYPQTAGS